MNYAIAFGFFKLVRNEFNLIYFTVCQQKPHIITCNRSVVPAAISSITARASLEHIIIIRFSVKCVSNISIYSI